MKKSNKPSLEELLESRERFLGLYENSPIGIAFHKMIYDENGGPCNFYYISANKNFQKFTGIDPTGKMVTEVFPGIENDPDFDWIGTCARAARDGETIRFQQYLPPVDRWYDIVAFQDKPDHFVVSFLEITEQKKNEQLQLQNQRQEMESDQKKLATAVSQSDDLILITDTEGSIEYVNPAFEQVTGYTKAEAIGKNPRILKSGKHGEEFYTSMWNSLKSGEVWQAKMENKKKDGSIYVARTIISPIRDRQNNVTNYVGVQHDITKEVQLESNLRHTQKLEALGTLAGGIAHEINTPAQFVINNLSFMIDSLPEVKEFISSWSAKKQHRDDEELVKLFEDNEVDYLLDEFPEALSQSMKGIEQIAKIVLSMKKFAHPGEQRKIPADINGAIESITVICRNEWRYVAELDIQADENLPLVKCNLSEINQVLLNIIVNAAHALLAAGYDDKRRGLIEISTTQEDNSVVIRITDNGCGIPPEIQKRIFDPFFTTKEVGQGSGQGLAIAHAIVVDNHQGKLLVDSQENRGTSFTITLPL